MSRAVRIAAVALACAALLPLGLRAGPQAVNVVNGIGLIDYMRPPDFEVGAWVQYRITGGSEMGMEDDYVVTVLIAGEEQFWGDECFWVETWTEAANRPPEVVATLMSYSIFGDTLAMPRLKLYMRKLITGTDENGLPVETVTKRPSGSLKSRKPPADQLEYVVDTLGRDTVMVPLGTYACTRVSMRQGFATTTDVGDSTLRTEEWEERMIFYDRRIPITSVAREDIESRIQRKTWKIGRSEEAAWRTMDRARGTARLMDFGTGLTPRLVPESRRKAARGDPSRGRGARSG